MYEQQRIRHKIASSVVVLSLVVGLGAGCASNTKTVRTETTHYPAGEPVRMEKKTTVTTETQEGSGGVLSGTVNVVGEVIALPFRAVGGLIRAIF